MCFKLSLSLTTIDRSTVSLQDKLGDVSLSWRPCLNSFSVAIFAQVEHSIEVRLIGG